MKPNASLEGYMHRFLLCLLLPASFIMLAACGVGTDAATRLAYDIEGGANHLGDTSGSKYSIQHHTPSKSNECTGPYKVQLDKVGALIVWCMDAGGNTVSSHSTSYHARFVDTPQTYILDKPASS
ncbi:MAG TPA: hypothetical protein VFW00_10325, partial [Rhodocyclaceae bacterium]|nr:hypothetical protein [Rhodocyclaceae bacterium]